MVFLESASILGAIDSTEVVQAPNMTFGIFMVVFLVFAALYIYTAAAFTRIGKKAKLHTPGVAWANPVISLFEISKMGWWPWPLLFLGIFLSSGLMILNQLAGLLLYTADMLFILVMIVIWQWKTFKAVKRPGWWALVPVALVVLGLVVMFLSPMAGVILWLVALLLYLVLIGLAAWGKK